MVPSLHAGAEAAVKIGQRFPDAASRAKEEIEAGRHSHSSAASIDWAAIYGGSQLLLTEDAALASWTLVPGLNVSMLAQWLCRKLESVRAFFPSKAGRLTDHATAGSDILLDDERQFECV